MKEYAIYLPDILIEESIDIAYIFNFKNIKIFTSSIYNNDKKVHEDDIEKILKLIKKKQIKGIIIYNPKSMPIKNMNILLQYCDKYSCKVYFFKFYFVYISTLRKICI